MKQSAIPCYIATANEGKKKELQSMIAEFFPRFNPIQSIAPQNAEETATTFIGNAEIKSLALFHELKKTIQNDFCVLADDSGMCVDLLGGAPGILSARYAGDHVDSKLHIEKVLKELSKISLILKERSARYICALSLIVYKRAQDKILKFQSEGQCEGYISLTASGDSGFGYDPIFYSDMFKTTLSSVSYEDKNSISHRKNAFLKLKDECLQCEHEIFE